MSQFIRCRFRASDKLFTYVNEGAPVMKGDFVRVPAPRSKDGSWIRVEVVEIDCEEPIEYKCKAILGIYNPDDDQADDVVGSPSPLI